ncbi:MAG TPA: hypothetical protein VK090_06625 [Paracoccaceae bacterium]|nr:hypothetical protein [Paracoccaceae bacterium]
MTRLRELLREPPKELASDALGLAIVIGWALLLPNVLVIASAVMEVGP